MKKSRIIAAIMVEFEQDNCISHTAVEQREKRHEGF